jgi:metal-sulfur cluster biosynthetic enzyme
MAISKEDISAALATVIDPELGIDIVALGLIYDISINGNKVVVRMTLTSPGCPLAPVIDEMIGNKVGVLEGVEAVETELVWDPPWTPALMDPAARAEFGFD